MPIIGRRARTNVHKPITTQISNVVVVPNTTGATISWNVNPASYGQIEYSVNSDFTGSSLTNPQISPLTFHQQSPTGLASGATVYFRILTAAGVVGYTSSFVTTTPDPVVSNVVITPNDTGASIEWNVSPDSYGQIEFGTSTAYANSTTAQVDPLPYHHQFPAGMPNGTLIYFRILTGVGRIGYTGTFTTTNPSPAITYDAIFSGDSTGATDVRVALRDWINANGYGGRKLALAVNGTYKIHTDGTGSWGQFTITPHDCQIDFRGSKLLTDLVGVPLMRCWNVHDVTFNDPWIVGNGYQNYGPGSRSENEHGFIFEGTDGVSINNIINRPNISYMPGDGIQVDGGGSVTVNQPDIHHCGRQMISNTRGQIIVNGGATHHIGLYAIDGEPNDAVSDPPWIQITVNGTDFRVIGDPNMPGHALIAQYSPGYTMVTNAYAGMRPGVDIRNTTADVNRMWFDYCTSVVVQGNSSDSPTTCQITHNGASVTYSGNTNITRT